MPPRQRVIAALRGERANKVPFTAYADQLPQSGLERRLRNGGLCIVCRRPNIYRTVTPHVGVFSQFDVSSSKSIPIV
jgi:hypothetical protein